MKQPRTRSPSGIYGPPRGDGTSPGNGLFDRLVSILPSIRLPLQLLGLIVTVVGFLIVRLVSPDNIAAMLSAGTVGVGLIIFATLFLIIPMIQKSQRAAFILALFLIYVATSVYLVKLTYDLVHNPTRQVSEESLKVVSAGLQAREQEITNQIASLAAQIESWMAHKNRSVSVIEMNELTSRITDKKLEQANLQRELAGVRVRQQSLRQTHVLMSDIVSELYQLGKRNEALKAETTIAVANAARGDFDAAERLYEQTAQSGKLEQGRSTLILGEIAEVKGNLQKALDHYRAAHQLLGNNAVAAQYHGRLCRLLGLFEESLAAYRHAFDLVAKTSSEHREPIVSGYAVSLWHHGDLPEARATFLAAYNASEPNSLTRALVTQDFGSFLWELDDLDNAEAKLREADGIYSRLEAPRQFLRYETLNNLGGVLLAKGRYEESRGFLEAALNLAADKIGRSSLAYSQITANLVLNRSRFGDTGSVEGHVDFLLHRESDGSISGFELATILTALSEFFGERLDFEKADDVLRRASGILSRLDAKGAVNSMRCRVAMRQVEMLIDRKMVDAAASELAQNADLIADAVRPNTRAAMHLERIRGKLFLTHRQWDNAVSHLESSIEIGKKVLGSDHPSLVWSLAPLARSRSALLENSAGNIIQVITSIATRSLSPSSRIWLELSDLASPRT
jgi:tetratricopeptide (TPR) repeat protein